MLGGSAANRTSGALRVLPLGLAGARSTKIFPCFMAMEGFNGNYERVGCGTSGIVVTEFSTSRHTRMGNKHGQKD